MAADVKEKHRGELQIWCLITRYHHSSIAPNLPLSGNTISHRFGGHKPKFSLGAKVEVSTRLAQALRGCFSPPVLTPRLLDLGKYAIGHWRKAFLMKR